MDGTLRIESIEAVQAFHEHLKRFDENLKDQFSSMRSHWQRMGDVWSDGRYDKFGAELDDMARGIDRYLTKADDYETYLGKLIEALGPGYLDV